MALVATIGCAREPLVEPAVGVDLDLIRITPTMDSCAQEATKIGTIYDGTLFKTGDKAILFAISRSAPSTEMPQSDALNFSTPNSFFWFKATGEYVNNPTLGSPFRVTGISTSPDASKYSNVPGGYLDFYAFAPVPPAIADISLRTIDPMYGASYGASKSLWIDLHNDYPVDGYDEWTAHGLKKNHVPIDYIYAVDGNSTASVPLTMKKKELISMRFRHALSLVEVKIYRPLGSPAATLTEICMKPFQQARFLRITDGAIAAWGNGFGDGFYYRFNGLNYQIPEGRDKALQLTERFILCPNVGNQTPSLNYEQFDINNVSLGCISTWLTVNGAPYYVNYGEDKTVFIPGYKYVVSIAMGLTGVTGTITTQPWISETSQNIVF